MSLAAAVLLLGLQELPQRALPAHRDATDFVGYTPDGRFFLTAGASDRTVKVWLTDSWKVLHTFPEKAEAMAIRPDGGLAAVGGATRTTIWNLTTGNSVHALDTGLTRAVGWSSDGKSLTTVSAINGGLSVRLWTMPEARERKSFAIPLAVEPRAWAVAPGGAAVAVPFPDGTVRLWDAAEGKERSSLGGPLDRVTAFAFSPDASVLATSGAEKTVRFWDASRGKELKLLYGDYGAPRVAFTWDGALAAVSAEAGIELWDVKALKRLDAVFGGPGTGIWTPSCLEFSPDGRWLAAGGVLIAKDAPAGKRVSGPVFFWKLK
jgi:WD40 repeat protein